MNKEIEGEQEEKEDNKEEKEDKENDPKNNVNKDKEINNMKDKDYICLLNQDVFIHGKNI